MEKVLFLINASEFGGLEIVLLDWLSEIDYSKAAVVLGCRGEALREKVAARGLPVEVFEVSIQARDTPWKNFGDWVRLFSSVRPTRIVFLEGNIGEFDLSAIFAARWSSGHNVQLFVGGLGRSPAPRPASNRTRTLHYGFLPGIGLHRYKKHLEHRIRGKLLSRTFVASQALKDNLLSQYNYQPDGISILYHGVDTRRFQPSSIERIEFRRANGIPDSARVIVSHGRLAPVKRVDRILRAFDVLSQEDHSLWLLLTAYGIYKEHVESLVASAPSNHHVKLVGFQEDASKILKASDIYILASDNEGFGIALVEAMSTSLVCVATKCEGPSEIIVDGENGFLVATTDEDVLAGLQRAMHLSHSDRTRLVKQGRETVESRFEILAAVRSALDSMGIARRR